MLSSSSCRLKGGRGQDWRLQLRARTLETRYWSQAIRPTAWEVIGPGETAPAGLDREEANPGVWRQLPEIVEQGLLRKTGAHLEGGLQLIT
jgi:hypothetical protein